MCYHGADLVEGLRTVDISYSYRHYLIPRRSLKNALTEKGSGYYVRFKSLLDGGGVIGGIVVTEPDLASISQHQGHGVGSDALGGLEQIGIHAQLQDVPGIGMLGKLAVNRFVTKVSKG
jgi:hypothetical protein